MLSQNWVTLLSLLVSGTMLFTLGATVVLYAKYKLGQKPVMQMEQAPKLAMAGGPSLSLNEAIHILNEAQFQVTELPTAKKRVRFSGQATGSGVK